MQYWWENGPWVDRRFLVKWFKTCMVAKFLRYENPSTTYKHHKKRWKTEWSTLHNAAPLAQVDSYDWVRDEWTLDVPPMKVARYDCAAVALPGDRALVAGGTDAGQSWLVSVEVYDDHIGGWAALPPLSIERDRCAAVALSAGDDGGTAATVLVMGGSARPTESAAAEAARVAEKRSGSPPAPPIVDLSSCETLSLDVHTAGSWLPAPELNFARCSFGAVALGGSVLVMGGGEGSATAERLDQDHRGWTTVASMPLPRSNTAAGHTVMVG